MLSAANGDLSHDTRKLLGVRQIRKMKIATAAIFIFHLQAAIKKGAPQAIEVADRWHFGKNLVESVQTLLARCRAEIRRGLHVQAIPEQERTGTEPVLEEEKRPARSRREEQVRLARRAQKLDRYEQVLELRDQGLTTADIGARIGISGRTVQRWLAHGSFPEARRRRRRPSLIDPYERYVLQWWQAGNRNGLQRQPDSQARGYWGLREWACNLSLVSVQAAQMSLNQVSSAISFGLGWQAAKTVLGVLNASWGSHVR